MAVQNYGWRCFVGRFAMAIGFGSIWIFALQISRAFVRIRWLIGDRFSCRHSFVDYSHGTADSKTVAAGTFVNWRGVLESAVVCVARLVQINCGDASGRFP